MHSRETVCLVHGRSLKFLCVTPCCTLFCTDCSTEHRNHFIRDLISFPIQTEIDFIMKRKLEISKTLEKIKKKETKAQGEFLRLDSEKLEIVFGLEKDYNKVLTAIDNRYKVIIQEVTDSAQIEKQSIISYLETLNTYKSDCQKKIQLLNFLLKQSPEHLVQGIDSISELTTPTPNLPDFPNTTIPQKTLFKDIGKVFENL
ncbi:hypothetical protein SteCoe_6455 [Stentor coeruleus]|uniref:B box-type domain-containing protein n=1 Tax=Stentor coeruleus TaxID=5963 RepID=A0A1R2CQ18_9CILI|nr:hypothetical protein SteCoe_6455 [Stentor coeruleus]